MAGGLAGKHRFIVGRRPRRDKSNLFVVSPSQPLGAVADRLRSAASRGRALEEFLDHRRRHRSLAKQGSALEELERRIVLSQYEMAAQSAGSWPSAETGLMGLDAWSSQFHMEMVWWHLAHYGLWDRWPMAEKSTGLLSTIPAGGTAVGKAIRLQGCQVG